MSDTATREAVRPEPDLDDDAIVEIAVLDRRGVIVWVNEAWRAFAAANGGDPERTGPGVSYLAVCDAAGDPGSRAVATRIRAALRGRLPGPAQLSLPCVTPGGVREFDLLVSPRVDAAGRPVGATVSLSERVRPAPAPVLGSEYDHVLSSAYSALYENSLDGVLYTSPDGAIYAANPAACTMLGRSEDEICAGGRHGLVDPADAARWEAGVAERRRTGVFRGELSMLRADGSSFPVELTSQVFHDEHGHERTCTIMRDISDRVDDEHRRVTDARRMALLTERERIVDALHSRVIQDLFATGLELSALAEEVPRAAGAVETLRRVIDELRGIVDSDL